MLLVVICFQLLFFVHLITTDRKGGHVTISCDLLSTFVLCTFDNNIVLTSAGIGKVVICFQLLFFVHLITTSEVALMGDTWL